MGYAQRANPRQPDTASERKLRRMLALFPDRATYEAWIEARSVDESHRAHMERYLPDALKAQGTV